MTKVAILSSHNGSGFNALYEAVKKKELNIELVLVISNNQNALVLQNATNYAIDNFVVNSKTDTNPDEKIELLLKEHGCKYIFLSGYMKKLSSNLTKNFKIINCHPALLPNYGGKGMYGRFVHEAVIKNREKESGVTIHKINENYDEGEILLQKRVALSEDESVDSLEKKIKELEQIAIVEAFKNI
ncbi:phosphoribosylglycinamide formyltransferase [Sulfurimonas sp.]|jgi:phosphoribosylglycinamide formyltransferase-1|uniref:phosphoribosylglycinamide formyltransferase n=1 Tax=Sulfurimonas sp. TaxID=2022749 RepID=UPI0025E96058|nr:phosphoribosylglycinamide formyltransferase [Sulfurimonas sp.]MCK9472299.1 phosphoribosylglycinamide formyltransferase [Sulfurimonas sp.]MDD3505806.1 phosphoribosylglycinamide formyltransferase [Sulfurimonas sp.]